MSEPVAAPEAGPRAERDGAGAALARRAMGLVSPCPAGFVEHVHEQSFEVPARRDAVWAWLDQPEHFSEAQVFPVRIEFASPDPDVAPGFGLGAINLHHGPMLGLAGVMTEVRAGESREMQYLYGSYVLSLRLIRPRAMRFELSDVGPDRTRVTVRFTSWLHPRVAGLWTLFQRALWWRLPAQIRKGVARRDD
jgi:hypothetical protein